MKLKRNWKWFLFSGWTFLLAAGILWQSGFFDLPWKTRVTGKVLLVSRLPDPQSSISINSSYSVKVELHSPKELAGQQKMLILPIMRNRHLNEALILRQGDEFQAFIRPFKKESRIIRRTRISDDIENMELERIFAVKLESSRPGNTDVVPMIRKEYVREKINSLPPDSESNKSRKDRIEKELARIQSEVQRHGGSFDAWKKSYDVDREEYAKLAKASYRTWIQDSFFSAERSLFQITKDKREAFIRGLIPFHRYLKANGTDLILLRVPSRDDLAGAVLNRKSEFIANPDWLEFQKEMLENDLEVIDPLPQMWEKRFDYTEFYFYHAPNESHPFLGTSMECAKTLNKVIQRYPEYRNGEPATYLLKKAQYKRHKKRGRENWPEGNPKFDPSQTMTFPGVTHSNGKTLRIAEQTGAPVLMLSNSFGYYPGEHFQATMPHYLTYCSGRPVDWLFCDGASNGMLKILMNNANLLRNRRAIILVVGSAMWSDPMPLFSDYFSKPQTNLTLLRDYRNQFSELQLAAKSAAIERLPQPGGLRFRASINQEGRTITIPAIPVKEGEKLMLRVNLRDPFLAFLSMQFWQDEPGAQKDFGQVGPPPMQGRTEFFWTNHGYPLKLEIAHVASSCPDRLVIQNLEIWRLEE